MCDLLAAHTWKGSSSLWSALNISRDRTTIEGSRDSHSRHRLYDVCLDCFFAVPSRSGFRMTLSSSHAHLFANRGCNLRFSSVSPPSGIGSQLPIPTSLPHHVHSTFSLNCPRLPVHTSLRLRDCLVSCENTATTVKAYARIHWGLHGRVLFALN